MLIQCCTDKSRIATISCPSLKTDNDSSPISTSPSLLFQAGDAEQDSLRDDVASLRDQLNQAFEAVGRSTEEAAALKAQLADVEVALALSRQRVERAEELLGADAKAVAGDTKEMEGVMKQLRAQVSELQQREARQNKAIGEALVCAVILLIEVAVFYSKVDCITCNTLEI